MPPERIVNMLAERKVAVTISGIIYEKFQKPLMKSNIKVIWRVVGEIHDVFPAHMNGVLHPCFGLTKAQGG